MRTLILLFSLCIVQLSPAQTVLPKLSLLADSGIREIRLTKVYQGYYNQDKLLNTKDSGTEFLEYRYTFHPSGKIASYEHFNQDGTPTLSCLYHYNSLGEPIYEFRNIHYNQSKDSMVMERTEDGGFLERKWHNERLIYIKRYARDSLFLEERYYSEKDSIITRQIPELGRIEAFYFFQGKMVRHVLNKWHRKGGKLLKYTEFETTFNSKKGTLNIEKDISFQVNPDSTLKLHGWYKDNREYTQLSYANWFRKLELRPIQYESLFQLDEFIPRSRQMFQLVTFSGEGHRYFYQISYR